VQRRGKDLRQIEAEVGQPYQGRAGDGATRAQMLFLGGQAHADGGVVEMLDAEIDVGGLRGAPGPSRGGRATLRRLRVTTDPVGDRGAGELHLAWPMTSAAPS
jgi:hypothetical protein